MYISVPHVLSCLGAYAYLLHRASFNCVHDNIGYDVLHQKYHAVTVSDTLYERAFTNRNKSRSHFLVIE